MHGKDLEKLYQQIVKHGIIKKKSEIPPSNAATSFTSDDYSKHDDLNASIQWTAPVVVCKIQELEY